jgi:hypothetical protein
MNALLTLSLSQSPHLSPSAFRERILLAWTRLRCQHILLQARTETLTTTSGTMENFAPQGLHFAVDVPGNLEQAREDARKHIVFLEDFYESVDPEEFYLHCQNVGRVVDAEVALAKCFVFPPSKEEGKGGKVLRLLFVGGIVPNPRSNNKERQNCY